MYTKSMYIGARQKKKIFISLCVLAVFVAIFFFVNWFNGEITEEFLELSKPQNVVLSNVSEDSVVVSWVTEVKTEGFVVLYENDEKVKEFVDSRGLGKSHTHYIRITELKPNTNYEFEIFSAEEKRLNEQGERFKFVTKDVVADLPSPNILKGILGVKDVLIFVLLDDLSLNYPASTYVSKNGEWSVDLSQIVSIVGNEELEIRPDAPLKILFFSNDGSKIIRGNKNTLFDKDGNLIESDFELTGSENVFLHIADIARFKEDPVFVEPIEPEEIIEDEDVMGVEIVKEEVEEYHDDTLWEQLEIKEKLFDYGLY